MRGLWHDAFLIALENCGSVLEAAKVAGISARTAYRARTVDPAFRQQWDQSLEMAADALEDEARKRAFAGSDVLLMFLLKGLRPQRWRESRATIPPAELNALIEREFARLAEREKKDKPLVN